MAFEVDADMPNKVMDCNCSHCRRIGFLLAFFPADVFTLAQGEGSLGTYRFNTRKLAHRFCTTCGVQPFAEGVSPDGSETRAVNMRCVPTANLDAVEIEKFDGASK